jgi:membrane-associated protease RseP (regulator of RpoE activity)
MVILALFGLAVLAVIASFGIYWFINRVKVSEREDRIFNRNEGEEK